MLRFTRSPTRSTGTWQRRPNELQQRARWLTWKGVRGYIWELQSLAVAKRDIMIHFTHARTHITLVFAPKPSFLPWTEVN